MQAERLTSRVGSISPTSSDTKRDFYSALPFDGAAAVVCAACIGLAGWVCYRFFVSYHLPSKKPHRKRVLKSSPLSLICLDVSFWHESEVRHSVAHVGYWGETGQHLLVLSFTGFDPNRT